MTAAAFAGSPRRLERKLAGRDPSAWLGIARGEQLPAALPADGAPLLATTLEALLRVLEVNAFAALVPLVERVGLTARDRHELLASMYFRRGFLDSAADEWIAVCREIGPDADALLGLAQVAVARELRDDALAFAREAHALDPSNAGAAHMVEALSA